MKKPIKILLIILAVILIIIISLVSAFFILKSIGKNKLRADDTLQPEMKTEEEVTSKEYSLVYNGEKYKYKSNSINVLLMGIDTEDEVVRNKIYGDGGQVDSILLVTLDFDENKVSFLNISRDTMCEVEKLSSFGESLGTGEMQLSLSHAYGEGAERSCEITRNAVSELLFGLPIHAYASMNLGAIRIINDSVGGVDIVVDEFNHSYFDLNAVGDIVHLNGDYARQFVKYRKGSFKNSDRMNFQKQYITAFVKSAKKAIKSDVKLPLTIYDKVDDYVVTDLDTSEILYLSTEALGMDIDFDFNSIKGETKMGDKFIEFYPDEDDLFETILDIFYTKVE